MPIVTKETHGACRICGKVFKKRGIKRHLKNCIKKLKGSKTYYLFGIYSEIPLFWLYVAVREDAKLSDLDKFLRKIWLECCGHLSGFEFEKIRYMSHLEKTLLGFLPIEERTMDVKVSVAFKEEKSCEYVYDYGSSTILKIELINEFKANFDKKIYLLSRNELPEIVCDICKRKAEYLCIEGEFVWLCKKHKKKCRERYALYKILNSPRIGTCGYGR